MFDYFIEKRIKGLKRKIEDLTLEKKQLNEQIGILTIAQKGKSDNLYIEVRKLYEKKKLKLLDLNREGKDVKMCKQLVHEINALNELLDLGVVNEENIAGSLVAYPMFHD